MDHTGVTGAVTGPLYRKTGLGQKIQHGYVSLISLSVGMKVRIAM